MPGCCVPNCSNRSEKGFRLFRLPQSEPRRTIWIQLVGRTNLPLRAEVCEVHFDEQQFENKRQDERKLLRRDAIPALLKKQEEIHLNKRIKVDEHLEQESQNAQIEEPHLETNVHVELDNQTKQNIIDKLKRQLKAEQQRNRHLRMQLEKKNETYNTVFNEDQLKFLETGHHRGFTWSDDTMNKALKLYLACGTNGYEEIRKQKLPYPSLRTLQDRIQAFKFEPGILQDVFNLLQYKIEKFAPEEKHASLLVDEMSIKPGIQYDHSLLACIGKPTMCLSGDKETSNELATHALAFMLTGVTKRWKQVVAYEFTGNSFSANEFNDKVTSILKKCTEIGLTVNVFISDMGGQNRALWRLWNNSSL